MGQIIILSLFAELTNSDGEKNSNMQKNIVVLPYFNFNRDIVCKFLK